MGHEIRVVFDVGAVGSLSDGQLLERFLARREEAVFEAIVRRHGPMVWGVCRRVLRDHHDAEDAFQATFLVLARKAASVNPRDRVGPWLHGVACRAAAKARATAARRRAREARAATRSEAEAEAESSPPDELLSRLDREVGRLPEKYRVPVVLCELEGKTHREVAEQLGWPIGTVSGRLSRARALLARRLGRPEPAHPSLPLVVALARRVVPVGLIGPVVRFAVRNEAGLVPASVVSLTAGVIQTMWLSQIQTTAAILLGCGIAAGATGLTYRALAADVPAPPPLAAATAPPTVLPAPPPVLDPAPPADPLASYPYTVDATEVYEFPALQITDRDFKLKADGPVQVLPMKTERGIAGAMLLGLGEFEYTPEPGKPIAGHQRAVMLRFNPEELAVLLPLDKAKKVSDQGAAELARHLLAVVVNHCYYRGRDIIIPPKGAFAAVLYTREHGDLLVSFDAKVKTAYNFTTKVPLYDKK